MSNKNKAAKSKESKKRIKEARRNKRYNKEQYIEFFQQLIGQTINSKISIDDTQRAFLDRALGRYKVPKDTFYGTGDGGAICHGAN